ncbi:MAG: triose-phosphate isomerase [Alphaproteobacteria bacterium]
MSRKTHIIGNWKMNGRMPSALTLCNELLQGLEKRDLQDALLTICPPAPLIAPIRILLKDSDIMVGGQDCHHAEEGAYTGDCAAGMLRDAGANLVLLGHSERRQYHHETNELIRQKADAAWAEGLRVVLCVGETQAQREADETMDIIEAQLQLFFDDSCQIDRLTIAYEPVWAIGTGLTATAEDANHIHASIRAIIEREFGPKSARELNILYGGSMKPTNAAELLAMPDIDGGLIGGASLASKDFLGILDAGINSKA